MKENQLNIVIDRPVKEVFDFITDPNKTPLWLDFVVKEELLGARGVGSLYRNINQEGEWSEYVVSDYVENELIEFMNGDYHCRYSLALIDPGLTELTYSEWVTTGDLLDPFVLGYLDKLKQVVESS